MNYKIIFLCLVTYPIFCQIGGTSNFSFLELNNSPRIIGLGGYLTSTIDADINNSLYNPALINSKMSHKVFTNISNYYSDILHGNIGSSFDLGGQLFVASLKFIDYGNFDESNEFGQITGNFNAGEYSMKIGTSFSVDSTFNYGFNGVLAYSNLYHLNSFAMLLDIGFTYSPPKFNFSTSAIIKNFGVIIDRYSSQNSESLPFEFVLGLSSKPKYMPLRWHLTLQHMEKPDLSYSFLGQNVILPNRSFFEKSLLHLVLGIEFLIHENLSFFLGYNNRIRNELALENRRGLVGFSTGVMFQVKRFNLSYSISNSHLSSTTSTIGITTLIKK